MGDSAHTQGRVMAATTIAVAPVSGGVSTAEGTSGHWEGILTCTKDPSGCLLFACCPCTLGLSACYAKNQIGQMIGTPDAIEATSYGNQCINCISYCLPLAVKAIPMVGGLATCLAEAANVAVCPRQMQANLDYRIIGLAQARLNYAEYPGPFAFGARAPGMQMEFPCTAPCTYCLVYRTLKENSASLHSAEAPPASGRAPTAATPTLPDACCSHVPR